MTQEHLPPRPPDAALPQLLATEHWSLLATRSMTWSEIMSRITILLTIASASLVVLALVAQASGFGTAFQVLAIGLAAVIFLLGTLTGFRVAMASEEDHLLVTAMNRLRASYVELAPEIAPYLMTSTHDDTAGAWQTYTLGGPRSLPLHIVSSTTFFLAFFNSIVAGTLVALIAHAADAKVWLIAVLGTLAGLGHLLATIANGKRWYAALRVESRFPTP